MYRSERVPCILDHGRILADLGQDVVVVLYRGISQTIERANTGIQFWREFGMHPIENGHHQPGDLAPNVHIIINALSQTYALLVLVIDESQPRFHAIAGVVDCGMYFPEGSHTSFTYGLQNKRRHSCHNAGRRPHDPLNDRNRLSYAVGHGKDF